MNMLGATPQKLTDTRIHVLKGFGLLDHQVGTGLPTRIIFPHLPNAPGNDAELRRIMANGCPFKCRHVFPLPVFVDRS